MVGMDAGHFRIVAKSLTGGRAVDAQTFASLTILAERLEKVKKLGEAFGEVGFSSAVGKLTRGKKTIAIG